MILERSVKEVEKGLNDIIQEIELIKSLNSSLVDMESVGAVESHLNGLKKNRNARECIEMF